jgi:hypothetical protein
MSATLEPASRRSLIEATFNYLGPVAPGPAGGVPRTYTFSPPAGEPACNFGPEPHVLPVHDLRPIADDVSLDVQGFGVLRQRSAVRGFADEAEIRAVYYPETERLIRDATGADRVFLFDHTVRRHIPGQADGRGGPRQPVLRVHVDHTERSGPQRVRDLLPDDAEELLRGRVQVINLWRPINGPVEDRPLAVADARTVALADLVPHELIYPDRVGETYQVRFNPAHRWFYLPNMRDDEALLIKCFDSKTDGRARFAPHAAFEDPMAPVNARQRESIEMRALVFHKN